MTVEEQFGKRLKEFRKIKNVNQTELSEAIGVNVATVSKWENGYRIPEIATLKLIAEYFNTSVSLILSDYGFEEFEKFKSDEVACKLLTLDKESRIIIDAAIEAAYNNKIEGMAK